MLPISSFISQPNFLRKFKTDFISGSSAHPTILKGFLVFNPSNIAFIVVPKLGYGK